MAQFFEDLDNDQSGLDNKKPFFAIDHDNDKELIEWLTQEVSTLKQANNDRLQKVKNNYARYRGIQYREQVYQPRDLPEKRVRYMPQVVIPVIADVVDEKVARLHEYKPAVQVIPHDDESQDKIDVKIAKKFIKHIENQESLDKLFRGATKSSKIAGESFVFILWKNDKGATVLKAGESASLPDGTVVKGPIYEGDVDIFKKTTLEVLYERAKNWDRVEYIFMFDYDYTEKLKREYPEKAEKIKSNKATTYYDFETMDVKSLDGMSSVITFFHKKTKYLADGYECKFTADVILKKGPLLYNDGELPCVRWVDVENEEQLSGESFIEKVKAMSSQYNNLTNMIIKQQMLCSHPHWFVEGGSVDDQALGNDVTIVRVKPGFRNPTLAQSNPVSPQIFEFRENLKQEFYSMAKSNSVVQGQPPPGVTAFVALQYVSESENRRISTDVATVNESIRLVYDKILKVCGQFYKKNDKRTIMVLGKDNRWNSLAYNPESLQGPYSIYLQSSSALPESKALRTQFILDMAKTFPNLFPESQLAEMLDLGNSEKVLDIASLAARSAEDENEYILDGKGQIEPAAYEDLITHWRIHVAAIQDIGFKTQSSPEVQEAMKDHLLATEMLIWQQSIKSQSFAQLVNVQMPQFPILFEVPKPPTPEEVGLMQQEELAKINPGVDLNAVQAPQPMPGDPGFQQTKRPDQTKVGAPAPDMPF